MTHAIVEPNEELAVMLLAAGHDEKELRRHAGFSSIRAARDFANRADTKAEVERAVEASRQRLGIKSLACLEQMIDNESTTGRDRVAALRTGLEVSGLLRKDLRRSEARLPHDLSAEELSVMIEQTRAELAARLAKLADQPAALISSS
jgi:hypothetical protein